MEKCLLSGCLKGRDEVKLKDINIGSISYTFQSHPTLLLPGPYPKRNPQDQSSQHISSNQKRKTHIVRSLYRWWLSLYSYPIGLCCVENLQSRYCNSLYSSLLSTCLPMQGCLIKGASAMFCSIELSLCISSLSLPSYLS